MIFQILIENSTGDAISGGPEGLDLTNDGKYIEGETSIKTGTNEIICRERGSESKEWHRWNGSSFELFNNSNKYNRRLFNTERSRLFRRTDWIRDRHKDQIDQDITTTLTVGQYNAWLTYWTELRDLPSTQGFDAGNPSWPVRPS